MTIQFIGRALVSVILAMTLAAAGPAAAWPFHHKAPASQTSETTEGVTTNYGILPYPGFNDDGSIRTQRTCPEGTVIPVRQLCYSESRMLDGADGYCTAWAKDIVGHVSFTVKNGVRFATLGGLGTALGAIAGFPGSSFWSYLKYGGLANAGSSLAATELTWDEIMGVAVSYCVMSVAQKNASDRGDQRLKDVMVIPVPLGKVKRPTASSNPGTPFGRTDSRHDPADMADVPPPPPVPVH